MTTKRKQQAATYRRVASEFDTGSLARQEECLRLHAKAMGYKVVADFADTISGNTVMRPGIDALLAHLRKHPGTIVLIESPSRLARSLQTHLALRELIVDAGGMLECPRFELESGPEPDCIQGIMAALPQREFEAEGKD